MIGNCLFYDAILETDEPVTDEGGPTGAVALYAIASLVVLFLIVAVVAAT